MKKRIISIIMSFAMILGFFVFTVDVNADDAGTKTNCQYDTEIILNLDSGSTATLVFTTNAVYDMNITVQTNNDISVYGEYPAPFEMKGSIWNENGGGRPLNGQDEAYSLQDVFLNDGKIHGKYNFTVTAEEADTVVIVTVSKGDPSQKAAPNGMSAYGETDITFYYGYEYPSTTMSVVYDPYDPRELTSWEYDDQYRSVLDITTDSPSPTYSFKGTGGPFTVTARNQTNPDLYVNFNIEVVDDDPPAGSYTTYAMIAEASEQGTDPETMDELDSSYTLELGKTYTLYISYFSSVCCPAASDGSTLSLLEDAELITASEVYNKMWDAPRMTDVGYNFNIDITAEKAGTEKITLGQDKIIEFTVVGDGESPTAVKMNEKEKTMYVGKSAVLSAAVEPADAVNKNVTWTSSDTDVAEVDKNGKITTKKVGKSVITVTTEDGGLTDECELSVLFNDVNSKDQYYFDAVYWAVDKGITQGTSPSTFNPTGFCKRYQFVLFLWRQAGCPEPSLKTDPFTDVKADPKKDAYEKAVLWAVENGITTGTTKTTFDPYAPLTRGQVVTFLYRAAEEPPVTITANPFRDLDSSKYYYKPVLWAVEKGITTGVKPGQFQPTATCTRGQTVVFMHRLFK